MSLLTIKVLSAVAIMAIGLIDEALSIDEEMLAKFGLIVFGIAFMGTPAMWT